MVSRAKAELPETGGRRFRWKSRTSQTSIPLGNFDGEHSWELIQPILNTNEAEVREQDVSEEESKTLVVRKFIRSQPALLVSGIRKILRHELGCLDGPAGQTRPWVVLWGHREVAVSRNGEEWRSRT